MATSLKTRQEIVEYLLGRMNRDGGARRENSSYYEAEKRPAAIGIAVPPAMKKLLAKIGWPRMYVDSLEERLDVEGFRMGTKGEANKKLWDWWQANQMDVESGLAHTEALIHGRCYVSVSAPDPTDPMMDPTTPVIRVEGPNTMYAEVDEASRRVKWAIRVYKDPEDPSLDGLTLFLPNETHFLRRGRAGWEDSAEPVIHKLGVVPVIPILNKKRIAQTYGVSEIFPELRSQTDAAARLMMNMNATAELMAVPQRVLFGVDRDDLIKNTQTGATWEAYIANILAFGDAEGKITQLAAAELRNFGDAMAEISKLVAGITGLPPQYLAFSQDNPASADAIRASEDRLIKKSERKCRIFGSAWEEVMRLCFLVMEGSIPKEAFRMETIWRNPATPTFAAMADGVVKLATVGTPDGRTVLPIEGARIQLGYSEEEREQFKIWDKEAPRNMLNQLLAPPAQPTFRQPGESPPPRE